MAIAIAIGVVFLTGFATLVDWKTQIKNMPAGFAALASESPAPGQVIKYNGSAWAPGSSSTSVPTISSDYNFTPQSPSGTLTASTPATVILTPCPYGVAGSHTSGAGLPQNLYVAGTGTPEFVAITGGDCPGDGVTSGTIQFTPANSHAAGFTIGPASSGIQEAIYVAGPTGTVLIPSGTWPYYGTIHVPSTYGTCVYGEGMSGSAGAGTVLQAQSTAFAVDGLVYDPGTTYDEVCTGDFTIHPVSGTNSAGVLVRIRYRQDGVVQNIYADHCYDCVWMEGNNRTSYINVSGAPSHYGLDITCNGVNYPSCLNVGQVYGGHWTALAGGSTNHEIHIEAPTAGILLSHVFAEGTAPCEAVTINGVGTNPLNEIKVENSILDGCTEELVVSGNNSSYQTNWIQIDNNEINGLTYGVICQQYCSRLYLNGNIISAGGGVNTDSAVVISGPAKDITIANSDQINSDGTLSGSGILVQGSSTITGLNINGNHFGPQAFAASCVSIGSGVSNVMISGNDMSGCTSALVTSSPSGIYFGQPNYGLVVAFSALPTCTAALEGSQVSISDSTTTTWGATIAGSSTNHVLGRCNGSSGNYTVVAK